MANNVYVGMRYVLKIYENSQDPASAAWEANTYYEPLVMVNYNDSSYVSRKPVPATIGNPVDNPSYWALSGLYNGQIRELQRELNEEITNRESADTSLGNRINAEAVSRGYADDALGNRIDDEITARTDADTRLEGLIASEAGQRSTVDNNLQAQIDDLIAPSGGAPSAAEVTNARIGVDRTYSTLGEAVREQHRDSLENLLEENVYDIFCDYAFPSLTTTSGVSITFDGNGTFVFNGTATADINFNIYNDTSALPPNMDTLVPYHITFSPSLPSGVVLQVFRQSGGTWVGPSNFSDNGYIYNSTGESGMLMRWHVNNGTRLSNVSIKMKACTINKNNPVVYPTIFGAQSAFAINYCLSNFKKVIIANGSHTIASSITVPDGAMITGYGQEAILNFNTGIDGLILGASCTVENVYIKSANPYNQGALGTYSGILIVGNRDDDPLKYETKLSNLRIRGFDRAGITVEKTGYWVGNSVSAVNCEISGCGYGILLRSNAEFSRFTNMNCHNNGVGLYNQSGNNKFVNCSFSNNYINVYLYGADTGEESEGANNGHGCMVGCDINHANNNAGISILSKYIDHGFTFSACNIWYGRVEIDSESTGIILTNSIFGGGTPTVNIFGNSDVVLTNNVFETAPVINMYGTLVANNNYLFDGTPIQ